MAKLINSLLLVALCVIIFSGCGDNWWKQYNKTVAPKDDMPVDKEKTIVATKDAEDEMEIIEVEPVVEKEVCVYQADVDEIDYSEFTVYLGNELACDYASDIFNAWELNKKRVFFFKNDKGETQEIEGKLISLIHHPYVKDCRRSGYCGVYEIKEYMIKKGYVIDVNTFETCEYK